MRKIYSSSISDSELDSSSGSGWELNSGSGSGWEPDSGSESEPESLFPWNAPRAKYNKKILITYLQLSLEVSEVTQTGD